MSLASTRSAAARSSAAQCRPSCSPRVAGHAPARRAVRVAVTDVNQTNWQTEVLEVGPVHWVTMHAWLSVIHPWLACSWRGDWLTWAPIAGQHASPGGLLGTLVWTMQAGGPPYELGRTGEQQPSAPPPVEGSLPGSSAGCWHTQGMLTMCWHISAAAIETHMHVLPAAHCHHPCAGSRPHACTSSHCMDMHSSINQQLGVVQTALSVAAMQATRSSIISC